MSADLLLYVVIDFDNLLGEKDSVRQVLQPAERIQVTRYPQVLDQVIHRAIAGRMRNGQVLGSAPELTIELTKVDDNGYPLEVAVTVETVLGRSDTFVGRVRYLREGERP